MPAGYVLFAFSFAMGDFRMNLVVIPFHDYKKGEQQGFRDRDNHFLEFLLDQSHLFETVLVIDRPVSLAETLARRRRWCVKGAVTVKRGLNWKLGQLKDNAYVLDYLELSIIKPLLMKRRWWDSAYGSDRLQAIVDLAIRTLRIGDYLVLLHHPFGMKLVNKLKYKTLVFDAIDNFLKIEHFSALISEMKAQYDDIVAKADTIVCVSKEAKDNLFKNNEKARVISNGVNPDFFKNNYRAHNIKSLRETRGLKVGYVGTLSHRLDLGILRSIAKASPDVSFFLVGPTVNESYFAPLKKHRNVIFTGNIHYSFVPSILSAFDVCMIPHRVGLHENDGDCMKLYEYIAAGRPVISTKIAGAYKFEKYVRLVDDAVTFNHAIDDARKGALRAEYPTDALKGLTWKDKTYELTAILSENQA